jgi:hypothetical protein
MSERRHHDQDLHIGNRTAKGTLNQRVAALDQRRQRLDARALGDLHEILQDDRHADGGDQRREPERMAQRPVGEALDRPAVERGQCHRDQQHQEQRERHRTHADGDEAEKCDQRDKGAHHENVAVGEIDHANDAVDHRIADGDQSVDRAERDAVDQLLEEIVHALRSRLPRGRPADGLFSVLKA